MAKIAFQLSLPLVFFPEEPQLNFVEQFILDLLPDLCIE